MLEGCPLVREAGLPLNLWSDERQTPRSSAVAGNATPDEADPLGVRSRFQQDYDRLLFSTPVRRLADKTQVWPMDENDGVRTRLTHSHEVANLARSIGTRVVKTSGQTFEGTDLYEVIQPILSSIGLAHDLGNPPFGHQGEIAISGWFKRRENWIFTHENSRDRSNSLPIAIPDHLRPEFTNFDGNPQSLRLVTKLQTSHGRVGLDLTAATLAALLKYPVEARHCDKEKSAIKKFGYFESERALVEWIRAQTGLSEGQRHPLTWIMEACDDIAYCVLDVDDLLKKEIISPDDVRVVLDHDKRLPDDETVKKLSERFRIVNDEPRRAEIQRDIKIGYTRAYLIESLIVEASRIFVQNRAAILALEHEEPLMQRSQLCNVLKDVARQYAFSHRNVLRTEAIGAAAINMLMSAFWDAIYKRVVQADILSERVGARARYVYSMISPNYLEEAAHSACGDAGTMRYKELRLLTDMVSGMTDTFALRIWRELEAIPLVDCV
jgi:dGTPase